MVLQPIIQKRLAAFRCRLEDCYTGLSFCLMGGIKGGGE